MPRRQAAVVGAVAGTEPLTVDALAVARVRTCSGLLVMVKTVEIVDVDEFKNLEMAIDKALGVCLEKLQTTE